MGVNSIIVQRNLTEDTTKEPSGAVWGNFKDGEMGPMAPKYYLFKPDLYNCPVFASTVSQMGLITLQDTGVTIQGDPTQAGVMQWGGMDADNDAGIITAAGNVGTSFVISDSDARELWYEISLKKSVVTDNSMAFFAGLTEEGMATATDTLLTTDSAALKDKDFIGFHVDQADGDSIDFVYNKASSGGVTVKISGLSAMVAATWIKLAFKYRPNAPAARKIAVYVNNQVQSTYVTATNIAAATFPDGEELVPTIACKKGEATISTLDVRLWQCAQRLYV